MIDALLGALFVGLVIRGWLRGFVREVVGLAVIVAGTLLAFRLSSAAGSIVSAMTGSSADSSRFIGGVAVFLLVSIGGAVVSFIAHRGIRILPGLPTANRAAGAGFAGLAGLLATTVVFSALAIVPLPEGWEDAMDESAIARFLTLPDGPPQAVLGKIAGDRVAATMLDLQDVFGERHLVADLTPIEVPPAGPEQLEADEAASATMFAAVNETRIAAGAQPLAQSEALDEVAGVLASGVYESGRFALVPDVESFVERFEIPVVSAAEVLGLGGSAGSVHEAFVADRGASEAMTGTAHRRMGVSAVRGPTGLVIAIVLAS
ncbi:MAG: CvpA family protein [Acidimicrobiia bacterium]